MSDRTTTILNWSLTFSCRFEEQSTVEYICGQCLGVIKFNPAVAERMSKDPVAETLHLQHLPMLVKPKPWLSHNNGRYL